MHQELANMGGFGAGFVSLVKPKLTKIHGAPTSAKASQDAKIWAQSGDRIYPTNQKIKKKQPLASIGQHSISTGRMTSYAWIWCTGSSLEDTERIAKTHQIKLRKTRNNRSQNTMFTAHSCSSPSPWLREDVRIFCEQSWEDLFRAADLRIWKRVGAGDSCCVGRYPAQNF